MEGAGGELSCVAVTGELYPVSCKLWCVLCSQLKRTGVVDDKVRKRTGKEFMYIILPPGPGFLRVSLSTKVIRELA